MPGCIIRAIIEARAPEGAFPSFIRFGDRELRDLNSFTTAQVLRALRDVSGPKALTEAREKALDFLLSCKAPERPGAFRYWPDPLRPPLIPELPADSDDTAIILLELVRHGRVSLESAVEAAASVLVPHRLKNVSQPAPSWLRPGVFLTWLGGEGANIVDCCANANVVALLAYTGHRHFPGYREACSMIEAGILWTEGKKERIQCLTPFYPHPAEFVYAIRNAVASGAKELEKSLNLVHGFGWLPETTDTASAETWPICSDAYGTIVWSSGVLQKARSLSPNNACLRKQAGPGEFGRHETRAFHIPIPCNKGPGKKSEIRCFTGRRCL
ncbi:TPA: hypothetical protein HA351_01245 [Methanosarcinaceae archaeon]|nr:hypothetical protein [Methanosarcinaceae archaeon]